MTSDQCLTLIGRTIDNRYEVERKLAEGGMGEVYLASDRRTGGRFVLKSPFPGMLIDDPGLKNRFIREIRVMSRLDHPNIIKVYDVIEHDGRPVAVMQYMSGGDLEERGEIALENWLPQIAGALDYLYAKKLVHRDVKPANILFDSQGTAYLGDLGIVKALEGATTSFSASQGGTQSGSTMGTPKYMSPEAVEGRDLDGRSDQYSLAIVVYERLTGRTPFDAETPAHIFAAHLTGQPHSLSALDSRYGEETAEILNRALSKRREDRFGCCQEFAAALLASLVVSSTAVRPVGSGSGPPTTPIPPVGGSAAPVYPSMEALRGIARQHPHASRIGVIAIAVTTALGIVFTMISGELEGPEEEPAGLAASESRRGEADRTIYLTAVFRARKVGDRSYEVFRKPDGRGELHLYAVDESTKSLIELGNIGYDQGVMRVLVPANCAVLRMYHARWGEKTPNITDGRMSVEVAPGFRVDKERDGAKYKLMKSGDGPSGFKCEGVLCLIENGETVHQAAAIGYDQQSVSFPIPTGVSSDAQNLQWRLYYATWGCDVRIGNN